MTPWLIVVGCAVGYLACAWLLGKFCEMSGTGKGR